MVAETVAVVEVAKVTKMAVVTTANAAPMRVKPPLTSPLVNPPGMAAGNNTSQAVACASHLSLAGPL